MSSLVQPAEQVGERVPYACAPYVYLGRTLVEWNELEEAEPLLLRGIELAELALQWDVHVDGCRDLALLHWIRREYAEAHTWIDKAVQACREDPSFLDALRARIWLAQADGDPRWLETAIRWAERRTLEASGEYDWELQTLIRVRIAQHRACGEPDLAPILALLDKRLADPPTTSSGWLVQNLLLKASLLDALGRREEALSPLLRAIEVAERAGWMLVFVEHGPPMYDLLQVAARQAQIGYVRQILVAFEARGRAGMDDVRRPPPPPAQAALVEQLTRREREVLRLLATTLSGPELANRLTISLSTLRTHTKNIYAKLGAHSRLDAVSRAAELGLLSGPGKTTRKRDDRR
jgi:ATP/maltotriose-dependent transcriptional regulator MalT